MSHHVGVFFMLAAMGALPSLVAGYIPPTPAPLSDPSIAPGRERWTTPSRIRPRSPGSRQRRRRKRARWG